MSVGVALGDARAPRNRLALRFALAASAVALAAFMPTLLAWLVMPGMAAPPPRSPFGIGFREAAPSATGLGGWLLAVQSSFSRSLQGAVSALRQGG
ncbi:MAG: nickel transporter, partial [Methylobacterium sp.]